MKLFWWILGVIVGALALCGAWSAIGTLASAHDDFSVWMAAICTAVLVAALAALAANRITKLTQKKETKE